MKTIETCLMLDIWYGLEVWERIMETETEKIDRIKRAVLKQVLHQQKST